VVSRRAPSFAATWAEDSMAAEDSMVGAEDSTAAEDSMVGAGAGKSARYSIRATERLAASAAGRFLLDLDADAFVGGVAGTAVKTRTNAA
jgi:hypothetical protein